MSSLADWLAFVETSQGVLKANSKLSFIFCLLIMSFISFSREHLHLLLSLSISSFLAAMFRIENFGRHVRASGLWFAFAVVIMVPRFIQVGLDALIVPLRVCVAVFTLSILSELVGFRRLIRGFNELLAPLMNEDMAMAFEVFLVKVSNYARSLSRILLAKASRVMESKLIGEYSVISMAASELFFRGPNDAFRTSLVLRARSPDLELENSFKDTFLLAIISFTYAIPLIL